MKPVYSSGKLGEKTITTEDKSMGFWLVKSGVLW